VDNGGDARFSFRPYMASALLVSSESGYNRVLVPIKHRLEEPLDGLQTTRYIYRPHYVFFYQQFLYGKTLFSARLFLLICLPALAQRPKPASVSLPPADTVYFDRDWERTETLEEVAYARIAHHDAAGKTMGTVRDYFYPAWKKQWEGKMATEGPDKAMGLCCGWHENGQVSFRGTYVNGVQ